MENQNSPNPGKKRSKRFLVGYSIGLFLFAAVLILFSYASVEREKGQLQEEHREETAGFQSRIDLVNQANAQLEETVSTLESEKAALTEELASVKETLDSSKYAYEILWKLIKAETENDQSACASYLKQASELDMQTLLSESAFTEYTRIQTKFKGE